SGNVGRGGQVVLRIPVAAGEARHVGVEEVERSVHVGQVGGPHSAGVVGAGEVEQPTLGEHAPERSPVHEVGGVVQPHTGVPLERRRRDVVVGAHPQDRRVGVETGEDRVTDQPLTGGTTRVGGG